MLKNAAIEEMKKEAKTITANFRMNNTNTKTIPFMRKSMPNFNIKNQPLMEYDYQQDNGNILYLLFS